MENLDAVIIGGGPAGLATAASLQMHGLRAVILDSADKVGSVWRRHYDRLHLHTDRGHSGLPGLAMRVACGRYPSRSQFVEYPELYAMRFDIKPVFNANVRAVRREGACWRIDAGAASCIAPVAIVATGWANFPYSPKWPGMEIFKGEVLHSSA
jgi:cation diffusion facilitator CzcD-associated flavoprotein CzcO